MKNVVYTLAMVVTLCAWTAQAQPGPRTDIPALITAAGYPVEEHHVTTQDGFTLVMQRIPKPGAPVVFLQHGLVDSAATWLINEPYESLGFILSDAGYDVFLGNVRGNGQSWQGPSGCDYSDDCFWDWSWDQVRPTHFSTLTHMPNHVPNHVPYHMPNHMPNLSHAQSQPHSFFLFPHKPTTD